MTPPEREQVADVGLVLEGTYPYVLGGVSAWVDQIIRGLPEVTFSILYIGAKPDPDAKQFYELPGNVICLKEIFLHQELDRKEQKPARMPLELRAMMYQNLRRFHQAKTSEDRMDQFWTLLDGLREAGPKFRFGNLLRDRECWDILRDVYDRFCPDESFIDFFWTARFLHLPLWNLWQSRDSIPQARMYHSVSAGYAGLIGAIAARHRRVPYIVTEHGIYTKERIAEIGQADWIYEPDRFQINYSEGLGKLKQTWINLFIFLGEVAYQTADQLLTLYEGNLHTQVEFGAEVEKIDIVPNGIEPQNYNEFYKAQMDRWRTSPEKKYVGFIGRVVPIKDVKTLLRASRIVCDRVPGAEILIAGPYSEDPIYYDECRKIVKMLQIEDRVHFMGRQKLTDVLPKMDVIVLTSISEGLPLVMLEGMACGKPIVASDVGACRELIFGRAPEDRLLGRAGRITKIMSPPETANAIVSILENPATLRRMGVAGRQRAEQFYSMTHMLDSYRDLYRQYSGNDGIEPRPNRPAVVNRSPTRRPKFNPVATR
jgi:glycosyltransferase involved in cell wall biosynthesis